MIYARNGGIVRIFDVSSGSGRLYTVDGQVRRAITPTGNFRIQRKINGWRTSKLGRLYRPAYFYGGYALHGSWSVPAYPASHGCVRVTIAAMDRLYNGLPIGMPVKVYR
jgi:lipoprotein-anchoring transpeptidase ErfK/SrfK